MKYFGNEKKVVKVEKPKKVEGLIRTRITEVETGFLRLESNVERLFISSELL